MRALVVFESMFGNTAAIAHAVAEGLGTHMDVDVVEVGDAPDVVGADVALLVVGGPTHAFGLSREPTRQDAARQAGSTTVLSRRRGIREWLETVRVPGSVRVATFDTKVAKPRMPGSASRAAARRLRWGGCSLAARPQNFFVTGSQGPLVDGEPDRARRWADHLASARIVSG